MKYTEKEKVSPFIMGMGRIRIMHYSFNDDSGKFHNVQEAVCNNCEEIIGQMHFNCCGYSSNGWGSMTHDCKCDAEKTGC